MVDTNQIQNLVQTISVKDIIQLAVLFLVGFILIRLITRLLDSAMTRLNVNRNIHSAMKTGSGFILWAVLIVIIVSNLGVNLSGLVAVLSVLTLAVSLAVQGTLSNIAGGVQVVAARPFIVGDYVEIGENAGTVTELGLVYTRLLTPDGRLISIPNSQTATSGIVNYTTHGLRRQDVTIGLSYSTPPEEAEAALKAVLDKIPGILKDPAAEIRLTAYKDSAVEYTLRVWTESDLYWPVHHQLMREIYTVLAEKGISIPYPQLDVHVIPPQQD